MPFGQVPFGQMPGPKMDGNFKFQAPFGPPGMMPKPQAETGKKGEAEELKVFLNGKEIKVGPGGTVTLPKDMGTPGPKQKQ